MTDKDIVIRAAKILGCNRVTECKPTIGRVKTVYQTILYGRQSIAWMMTLYVLMGERRRQRICDCLNEWKNKVTRTYAERKSYTRGAKIVWSKEKIVAKKSIPIAELREVLMGKRQACD